MNKLSFFYICALAVSAVQTAMGELGGISALIFFNIVRVSILFGAGWYAASKGVSYGKCFLVGVLCFISEVLGSSVAILLSTSDAMALSGLLIMLILYFWLPGVISILGAIAHNKVLKTTALRSVGRALRRAF